MEKLELSVVLPATPARVYEAWLSGKEHAEFTGGAAEVDPTVGGAFSAWDGYISGTTVAIERNHRIVQRWRTTDFPPGAGDSLIEITLHEHSDGCELQIRHTEIPDGQGEEYRQGWTDYYFEPMKRYFS